MTIETLYQDFGNGKKEPFISFLENDRPFVHSKIFRGNYQLSGISIPVECQDAFEGKLVIFLPKEDEIEKRALFKLAFKLYVSQNKQELFRDYEWEIILPSTKTTSSVSKS